MPSGSRRGRRAAALLAGVLMAGNVSSSEASAASTAFVHLGRRALVRPAAVPAAAPRAVSSLRMRVEVEVKDRVDGPAASPLAKGKEAALTGPPPFKTDNFKHKSNADLAQEYGPYMNLGRLKLNLFGAWFMLNAVLLAIPWSMSLAVLNATIGIIEKFDPARTLVDLPCRLWARAIIVMGLSYPEITGIENMPEGPAVYVANHASWMDVPYAGLLPQASKYFAKSDLAKVPVLGWSMLLSGHIMVDRDDKRSQIESLVRAKEILKGGTPLFVFPEGTRGKEGRLGEFKGGAFRLAVKAGVPIVPISMAGTHLVMPPSVVMPHRPGQGITAVHVHPAIPTAGRSEKELAQIAFDIINDALPPEQKHLPPATETGDDAAATAPPPQH